MNYAYYSFISEGYFRCNTLISDKQISRMIKTLGQDREQFKTIQIYNVQCDLLSCPIYMDIDSNNLYDAWEITRDTIGNIKHLDITIPIHVWFSGSKGFHIILPYLIEGNRCFEQVREVITHFTDDADMSVYTNRRLWRVQNTINSKSGLYKVYLGDMNDLTLDKIIDMAKINIGTLSNMPMHKCKVIDELIVDSPLMPINYSSNNNDYFPRPCIEKLMLESTIDKGLRHQVAYVISRHFYLMELTKENAYEEIKKLPFYNKNADREFRKILRSVYTHGAKGISCKTIDDFLQNYCNGICPYQDWSIHDLFNGGIKKWAKI